MTLNIWEAITVQENLNQGDGNFEEFTQLILALSQQMQELEALNSSIPDIVDSELEARLRLIIEKLDAFIGTSAVSKQTMETILKKWLDLLGSRLWQCHIDF